MKKRIDWESIEREYRAGQLSVRELAAQYNCSHTAINKKVKKCGWEQDLSVRVKRAIATKLVSRVSKLGPDATDEIIVDVVSNRAVDVLDLHRKDIANLRRLEANLIAELQGNPTKMWIGQYQGEVIEKEYSIPATERSQAAANLATLQTKRIALERQAFNIIDAIADEDKDYHIHVTYAKGPEGHIR